MLLRTFGLGPGVVVSSGRRREARAATIRVPSLRVFPGDREDLAVDPGQRPAMPAGRALGPAVDRLAADPRDPGDHGGGAALRDQLAGTGDAHAHSHPRKSSSATSTSIVLRPNARSSLATLPRSSSSSVRSCVPDNR